MGYEIMDGAVGFRIVEDPYFALIVHYGDEVDLVGHRGFYGPDEGLVEVNVDPMTYEVRELVFTNVDNGYEYRDETINTSCDDEGSIRLNADAETYCSLFDVTLYRDGLGIRLGNASIGARLLHGSTIFSFGTDGALLAIDVLGMTPEQVAHAKNVMDDDLASRGEPIIIV